MKKVFTILLVLLFLTGAALVAYPAVSVLYNERHQSAVYTQYQEVIDEAEGETLRIEREIATQYNRQLCTGLSVDEAEIPKYEAMLNMAGNGIMGYSSLKEKIKISAYGKYLRELIKQEGMEEKIIFMGKLSAEEMKKQYLLSHCYVCASSIENSPNSLAEAMLLGVPVIAPNTGGIPSVMEGEKEGLLFQKNNWEDLAASIERIWKDDNLVNNISREGRKRAGELYNPETNYNRLLEIYNQMMEGK